MSTLRERAVEAFTNSVDSPRWRRQDGVNAVVDVVLGVVADEIKALYAEPPVEGAYRNEPGGMWFHGHGNDRTGLIGHGPSEADVLAVVEGLGGGVDA